SFDCDCSSDVCSSDLPSARRRRRNWCQGSVYVGTNFDGAFVRSVSDSDWHRLGWNLLKRCACQEGDSIAIDPGDHNHLLLTTNGGGLLASDDAGRSWHDGGTEGLTSNGPRVVAF